MNYFNKLSPFTRALAIVVVLAAVGGSYYRFRLRPLRADLAANAKQEQALTREVQQSRARVRKLQSQADSAERWSGYAAMLDEQSTGRSLREVLATCGTSQGPGLTVQDARFDRQRHEGPFARLGVEITVEGPYPELIRLLHELDGVFPPIEITRAALRQNDDDSPAISASISGVIHEPR